MEKIEYRPFSCDKCGCIHSIQTNHKGQVYNQKCQNWPCTAGQFDYTTMSYWEGKIEEKIARARDEYGNIRKLTFKI